MTTPTPAAWRPLAALSLLAAAQTAQAPQLLPGLATVTRIQDTAADAPRDWDQLLDRLAAVEVVFLGETHLDDTTHRVELQVLEGLLARRPDQVVLSLEMFERDVQPALDDYLAGRSDEATFLAKARPWGNYRTAYRPLVERARAAGIPVVAANFPGSLRRKLAMGGKQAFDALTAEQRALLPAEIFPAGDAYWQRVDRAVRGHQMGGAGGPAADRLYDGQNLWDNAMGDNVARARTAHPGRIVLHVAGGFHVAYRDGTVAQFARRAPGATAAVVSIQPVPALHAARPDRDRALGDYLVYAVTLAREEMDGTWAVEVPAELRYRLHAPPAPAPLPLLVWLPDRSARAEDALALWRALTGEDAMVAVVEPPFPELQPDLGAGGRYVSGDGFRADYGRVAHGIERIVEYLARNFAVDRTRVLVAGEGDGGAAVLWTALYGQWLEVDMLAADPGDLTRLALEALPDQRPPTRSLRLCGRRVGAERLQALAADFGKVGVETTVTMLTGSAELPAMARQLLGLPTPAEPAGEPSWLRLEHELPRARQWAELYAARLCSDGVPARVLAAGETPAAGARVQTLTVGGNGPWPIADFADGRGLPLAGGPFGGTTVLLLPAGISDADRAAWMALEQGKAIKQRSMFANLAVASAEGEPSLAQVLEQLRARGRSRVLVVPAVFCADAGFMEQQRARLGDGAQGMDLGWLPGLGGELATR